MCFDPFSHQQLLGPGRSTITYMQLSTATLSTSHLGSCILYSVSAVDIDDAVAVSALRQAQCIIW